MSFEVLRSHFLFYIGFVVHALQQRKTQTIFRESGFSLRDPVLHAHHCSLLDGHDSHRGSVEYGVNQLPVLDSLPCFNVVQFMPRDIVHNIFAGVIPHELKLLLDHCSITQYYFSVTILNHRITAFDYGYSEVRDKPAAVQESKLQQTASQMWLLARIFPLLVGDLVPSDCPHWLCSLNLLRICEIVLTPDTAAYLQILIEEHHHNFVKIPNLIDYT